MARRRKRIKFSPFRIGDRAQKSILATLGVILIILWATGGTRACRRQVRYVGDHAESETWGVIAGEAITYGEIHGLMRRWATVFGREIRTFDEGGFQLAQYYLAREAGIHISDAQVHDEIRNTSFPRRVEVQYAIAETREFEDELDDLAPAKRQAEARARARRAIQKVKAEVDAVVGGPLQGALKRAATEHNLTFGKTEPFTPRGARRELDAIRDAANITRRVFYEPIGQLSEPLPITGGYCVFRVVLRTRGFGPDGAFYPEQEGWVGYGYGTLNTKSYSELLAEMGIIQADLEQALRERLAIHMLGELVARTAVILPEATLRDRYYRDHTKAVAAYFAVPTRAFTGAVPVAEADLMTFYDEHKRLPRTAAKPGYLEPERVQIEFVLGRKDVLARTLDEATLRRYYERFRDRYPADFEQAAEKVRAEAADHELQRIIGGYAEQAANEAAGGRAPDLEALASRASRDTGGAFEHHRTAPFAADEAENVVPQLRGGKLAEQLFGDEGKQYLAEGEEPRQGAHVISPEFTCDAGRYFFRVLQRIPSRDIPYEEFVASDANRKLLERDYRQHRAFDQARAAAVSCRTKVGAAALQRLAALVGSQPVATGFLMPEAPIPPLGQPIASLYRQLERGAIGDLSDIVPVGEHHVVARLTDRAPGKGLKLEVLAFRTDALQGDPTPSDYQLQAAYDADPYAFLPKPKPIPFDDVKADIRKLLEQRKALDLATGRVAAAAHDLAAADTPDLAAAAKAHKLTVHADVKVDLAKTEAAPHVGRAAGFHDLVTSLEVGKASTPLASASGRLLFVLKARDEKTATIDVAGVAYEALAAEAKVEDKDVRAYYDEHRDAAYVTGDTIEEAPPWRSLDDAVRERVTRHVRAEWAKKPMPEKLAAFRVAAIQEAFRTVPARDPLTASTALDLKVRTVGPFPLAAPQGPFAVQAELVDVLRDMEVGTVSKPLRTKNAALLALLAARKPGGKATLSVAVFDAPEFLDTTKEPSDEALERYYAEHKDEFRDPLKDTVLPFTDPKVRARITRTVKLEGARQAAHAAAAAFRAEAARTTFDKAVAALGEKAPAVRRGITATAPRLIVPQKGECPALADAVFALEKPGLTPVVDDADASLVAVVSRREVEPMVEVDLVMIGRSQVGAPGMEVSDQELAAHYEKHKERFGLPDQLRVEFLAADYLDLAEKLTATDEELRQEYDRSVKARESRYRDFSKPGIVFLPFERAKADVRRKVLTDKARAKARTLLDAAAKALRADGAKADLEAYAAKTPGLTAGVTGFFDAEAQVLEPIGRAADAVKAVFGAKDGEIVGPQIGPDGAALLRRKEFRKAHTPPLKEQRYTVQADLLRERDVARAMEVAATLRDRVIDALAKAQDAREAFRATIEDQPVLADVPLPATVTLTAPFYPLDAGWGRSSAIPGLGEKPDLNRAIFALRPGELAPVIDDPDRSACYVATLTRRIAPDEPKEMDILEVRSRISRLTAYYFLRSWEATLNERRIAAR